MTNRISLIVLVVNMVLSFGIIHIAWAGNASMLFVEISYPCDDNQAVCDTGEAVSREVEGDKVNVYITLLDAAGNLATTGPAGESLETFTISCSSNLGSIYSNRFAADVTIISFNGDATARATVDYTGSEPGVDQIICVASAFPDPIIGTAYVNVATSSSSGVIEEPTEEPTEEATGIVVMQEGPQDRDGSQITPCGEAIIQIFANGALSTSKNIEINFGEGSVEGAELRTLDSDQSLPIPLSVGLDSNEIKRYVVYSPGPGNVWVEAVDLGIEPLYPAILIFNFCPCCAPFVYIYCDETFLCPGVDCLTCETTPFTNEILPYTWELNGEAAYTGNSIEICPRDLDDGYNTLTVIDTTYDVQDTITIAYNTPDLDCPVYCGTIDVAKDTVLRSRWFPSVALITVNGSDTLWQKEQYTLEYTPTVSRDLFVLPGTLTWLDPVDQTINQLIIILPSWWSGCCFDGSTEMMTVEVCDTAILPECCVIDTVEIDMMALGLEK